MRDSGSGRSGGIGFFGALGLLFIGLRLASLIDWPWWVVLAPIWGSTVARLLLVAVIFLGEVCKESARNERRR